MTRLSQLLTLCLLALAVVCHAQDEPVSPVREALAELTIPPAWVADVEVTYDMNRPWQEARRDIRGMLGRGGDSALQAMKLTWLYKQKGDIGDGSEYGFYMFLGGDPLWALANYAEYMNARLAAGNSKGLVWPVMNYASCCSHFGDHALALNALNMAYEYLPDPPNDQMALAKLEEKIGDTCALMGDSAGAVEHFAKAAEIYPTLTQRWVVQHLADHLGRLEAKTAMASMELLELQGLTDGVYTGSVWGYEDYLKATVTVVEGAVTDIQIEHRDSIPQTAPVSIPEQVIEKQSLEVDTVTGATVTSQAVLNAIFRALSQAGLQ